MAISSVIRVPYAAAGFGDQLTHDLAHGVPSATAFFPARHWSEVVRQIDQHRYPRAELVSILEKSAEALSAAPESRENIRKLAKPNTYVVATGQQAGLLGGPLYSLHKALTAIKLAQKYTAEAGGVAQFVPVFWVASDDHDLGEIDHADFLDESGRLTRVRPTLAPDSVGCSASDARIDAKSLEEIQQQLARLPSERSPAAPLLESYRGSSLGNAFATLLTRWLSPLGLIVVQSTQIRSLAADLIKKDLDEYATVTRLIQEAGLKIQQHGYKPGFPNAASAPHFFIYSDPSGIRAHVDPQANGSFRERGAAFALRKLEPREHASSALHDLIRSRPELFSASASLRPVLQQRIFPVAAAVLGPGEIAYWAQLKRVHDHFNTVWPVVVPRATLTLIDAHGSKLLRKLGLTPGVELFGDEQSLRRKLLPAGEVRTKLDLRSARILAEVDAMGEDVRTVSGGLNPLIEKARARIEHELQRIAEKAESALNEKQGVGQDRLRYLSALIRPKNSAQERVLSCAQFLVQYPNLPAEILDAIDLSERAHFILVVE
jgi:bacillithiol synthase